MGMDVTHFVIKKTMANTDKVNFDSEGFPSLANDSAYDSNLAIVVLTSTRLLTWAVNNSFHIHTINVFDFEKWYADNYPEAKFEVFSMDVNFETVDKFIYMHNPETGLYDYIYTGFDSYYKEHNYVIAEVEKCGYMRKPFSHSAPLTVRKENETTICLSNFSDIGVNALKVFADYDEDMLNDCWVKVIDIAVLQKLSEYSIDKKFFYRNFIANFTNQSFIDFNW